jgi:hypothetical protein
MTQVTVPSAGDPITISWGQSVANHANHLIPLYVPTQASTTGTSFETVTGLTFSCVNGKEYNIQLVLLYSVGGTSTGIKFGFDHPGGIARILSVIYGNASATGSDTEWLDTIDTATGTTTTDSTNTRQAIFRGVYQCTADGTFSVRYARRGTSTTINVLAGSGGIVIEN